MIIAPLFLKAKPRAQSDPLPLLYAGESPLLPNAIAVPTPLFDVPSVYMLNAPPSLCRAAPLESAASSAGFVVVKI